MINNLWTVAPDLVCYSHPFDERFSSLSPGGFFVSWRTLHLNGSRLSSTKCGQRRRKHGIRNASPSPLTSVRKSKIQTNS
jgi:hypothetical protein